MNRLFAMALVCLLATAACGDDDDDAVIDGSVTTDAATNTHMASGLITDSVVVTPIAGMEVCLLEYPAVPCSTSSANGRFEVVGIPNGVKHHLIFTKQGYYPKMFLVAPRTTDLSMQPIMQTNEVVASWFTSLAITNNAAKGIVTQQVPQGPMFVGATFALSPASPGSFGPGYGKPDFAFDPTLTATTTSGVAGFLNVEPGTYSVAVTPPTGKTCSTTVAGTLPMSAEVLSRAGFITHLAFSCQ